MKLYLSSYRIPDIGALESLIGKPVNETSVGVVTNAKDSKPAEERERKIAMLETYLADNGFCHSCRFDLRRYGSQEDLGRQLSELDVIYVQGGNTFDLMSAVAFSGFKNVIGNVLARDVVYLGESAGAIIAGPSLRGFESVDVLPETVEPVWDGIGLIDEVIVPHHGSSDPKYKNRVEDISDKNSGRKVTPLRDNEAIAVDGPDRSVVVG